jgi:hypothetical protein
MCFIWFLQLTVILSLNSINQVVFVMETRRFSGRQELDVWILIYLDEFQVSKY